MRQTISGLVAAIAVVTVSAAPAMACGGVFGGSCYVPVYTYAGCYAGCWPHERLPDPVLQYGAVPYAAPQYYYVNQGPTYTGPGNFAPYPFYQEGAVSGRDAYRRSRYHYGHAPRHYGHHQYVQRRYY
jgi:hypothetical protein